MDLRRGLAGALDAVGGQVGRWLPRSSFIGSSLRDVRARLPRQPEPGAIGEVVYAFGRARRRDVFFVQVGSNDGDRFDPLSDEILGHRWSGIMIEPVPYVFERLRKNQRWHARIRLENAAISDHDGSQDFHYLAEAEDLRGLPSFYDALGSFRREILLKHAEAIPDIEHRLVTVPVACLTFDSLCRKHAVERIDVLHIDTEGFDYEVLKQIDLDRWTPALLIYEHVHLSPDDLAASRALLESHGYELLTVGLDTAGLRVGALGARDAELLATWRRHVAAPGASP